MNDLKSKGYTFILPVNDDSAMNELAEPMRRLIKQGTNGKGICDDCRVSGVIHIRNCMREMLMSSTFPLPVSGVRGEFVIDAFVKRPELLRVCTKQFTATWAVLELLVERCALTYEDAMRLFAR